MKKSEENESLSDVFETALEIMNKKFPKNATDLRIKTQVAEGESELLITKEKDQTAKLTKKRAYYYRKAKKQKVDK